MRLIFATFAISTIFWHDISELGTPNTKLLDMHIVRVHRLTAHAWFQSYRSKTVGPIENQSPTCIISIDLIW